MKPNSLGNRSGGQRVRRHPRSVTGALDLLDDPWVAAQIQRALAPYIDRLSKDQLEWMRCELAETLARDHHAAALLRAAHPHGDDETGEIGWTDAAEQPDGRRLRGKAG